MDLFIDSKWGRGEERSIIAVIHIKKNVFEYDRESFNIQNIV